MELDWTAPPREAITIAAGPRTDLFIDPAGGEAVLNAPLLLGATDGDFLLSAHVHADLRATFDAGALMVHAGERTWAKLALERSPQGDATIVSVVTRDVSDDANGPIVVSDGIWLRVARISASCALHSSTDGRHWDLVRHFALDAPDGMAAGFLAQSPTGQGCAATFDDVRFETRTLADLRDGS